MIDRITNIFLLFLLILGFVAVADAEVQQRILWAVVAGGVFGALSFFLNWLTLDGSTSAWLLGVITFGIAGFEGAAILLFFFISSSLLSKNSRSMDDVRDHSFFGYLLHLPSLQLNIFLSLSQAVLYDLTLQLIHKIC